MLWLCTEAVIEIFSRRHLAAVVAGEPDRREPLMFGLGDGRHQVLGVARGRQRDRDIAVARMRDDLPFEDQVEADVVAKGGDRVVRGQRPRCHGSPARGRLNSDASVAASVELPPLPKV